MIGVFGIISFRTYTDCPTSGCPPYSLPAYYLLPVASFFLVSHLSLQESFCSSLPEAWNLDETKT